MKRINIKFLITVYFLSLVFIFVVLYFLNIDYKIIYFIVSFIILTLCFYLYYIYGKRKARDIYNGFLYILFVGFIIVMLNAISSSFYYRYDMTLRKVNTLDKKTIRFLKNLNNDIKIVFFYNTAIKRSLSNNINTANMLKIIHRLYDSFKYYTNHIKLEIIDPDTNPKLAEKFKVKINRLLFVQFKDNIIFVKSPTQQDFLTAMISAIKDNKKTVYFVSGHGELSFKKGELSLLKSELEYIGYKVKQIKLSEIKNLKDLPSDLNALVAIENKYPYLDNEKKLIIQYIKAKKPLLVLGKIDFINKFLHIKFSNNYIQDILAKLHRMNPFIVFSKVVLDKYEDFSNVFLYLYKANKINFEDKKYKYEFKNLLVSHNNTVLLGNDKKDVKKGPFLLGVVSTKYKVTVIASSWFVTDVLLSNFAANKDFIVSLISDMLNIKEQIGIVQSNWAFSALLVPYKSFNYFVLFLTIILPILLVLLGVAIWLYRKNLK